LRPAPRSRTRKFRTTSKKTVKPAAQLAHPGQPVDLDDYRDQIEQTLAGKRADLQLDNWLKEARKRVEIVYHDEVFK
jgi:hypothetical protein